MPHFLYNNVRTDQNISLPIRQMETFKMYLLESHFFKDSLAGASGQVLMSDPAFTPAPLLHRGLRPTVSHLVHTRGVVLVVNISNYPPSKQQCHLSTRDDIQI